MAGPMPHCAPGKRFVTAAAIRCAVLWRTQRQRLWTLISDDADRRIALQRVRQVHELAIDDRRERRLGESAERSLPQRRARACPADTAATGSVGKRDGDLAHWISCEVRQSRGSPTVARRSHCGPPSRRFATLSRTALSAPSSEVGRRGWTRTTDLLRVREAL